MLAGESERRLCEWGRELGGGRYPDLGYPKQTNFAKGPSTGPAGAMAACRDTTPADIVECVVKKMEQGAMWELAQVLRNYYFRLGIATSHRLELLRAQGLPMSERTFYERLAEAREVAQFGIEEAESCARSA